MMKWEAGLNVGLNTDGYELDLRGLFFLNPYLGLKIGLGTAGEIRQIEDWDEETCTPYHNYATRFRFNPAVVFRSPAIFRWPRQEATLCLFAEPGFVLSPGASGSSNASWFNWDCKGGLNFQVDRFIITLGYGISDFSLYSGDPKNYWGLPDRKYYLTHSVFVGGAVKF